MGSIQATRKKLSRAAKLGALTRRVYRWEGPFIETDSFLATSWPVGELSLIMDDMWAKYFKMLKIDVPRIPVLIYGKGISHHGKRVSFYDPSSHAIVLVENDRNIFDLAHELAHASGEDYHDYNFLTTVFCMLMPYERFFEHPSKTLNNFNDFCDSHYAFQKKLNVLRNELP